MRVKKKKYISAIFCLLGFIMCILSCTFATVNAEGNASLTLNCVKDGEVITGMEWSVYHVAENLEGKKPKLTRSFNKYRRFITLGDGSLSAMAQLASTLKGYTLKGKIQPTQTAVSDGEGKAKFTNLEYGYYLITAKKFKKGDVAWESEPLLVILNEDEDYQLDAFPKMNYITLDANEVKYTVKKVWANDENQPWLRTAYITAELYCDDVYDSSIRLDESNNWTYSWTSKPDSDWVVVEQDVPENYVVTFRKQGVEYVIVNTFNPEGVTSWDEDDGEETTIATTHETGDQFTGSETTSQPTGQVTTEKESTTTGINQNSEELSSTTSSTVESGSDFDTSSTSSTSTSTTTTTRKPSGNGSGNTYGGGSSSSSRYSSGGGSSSSYRNSSNGTGSGAKSGSGNASSITKLPQTGQLWWPVVPLALGGILMMGIGLKFKEKDH